MSDTDSVPPEAAVPRDKDRAPANAATPLAAIERLTMVLQLQRRARAAEPEELPFVMVNETRNAFPYRQAVCVSLLRGRTSVQAISGLAVPDASSPYAQWITRFVNLRLKGPNGRLVNRIDFAKPEEGETLPDWHADWKEWLPPHGLWAPLSDSHGDVAGVLALFREEAFSDGEAALFTYLSESYGQSYCLNALRRGGRKFPLSRIAVAAVLAAAVAFFIPVRQTVLAPAEVTARRPVLVRSGLEGVVERILVEPNQKVAAGEPLVRLDDTQLRTRLAVAQKAEEMAEAEYRQLLQAALSDPRTKQRIPLAVGRKEQLKAETAYIESQIQRIVIYSPIGGVAICDNPDEWLGRPVSLGQRILLVADADDLELRIHMPAADAMRTATGDEILFYPNVSPNSPVRADISFASYRAAEVPGVGMAYTLRADLAGGNSALLGMRGTAKLYGERQYLGLSLLRKPIQTVRQWLGV